MGTKNHQYEIRSVGKLGTRLALFKITRFRQDNGTEITFTTRVGSIDVPKEGNQEDVEDLVYSAQVYLCKIWTPYDENEKQL